MSTVSRLVRRFCATVASPVIEASALKTSKTPHRSVYKKLSMLGTTGGTMEETLNQFIMEGVPIERNVLVRYVKDLRKSRRPQRALEVFEWMEKKEMSFSGGEHAIRLDLIARTNGLEAAENYFNSLDASTKNQSTYGSLLNCYCMECNEEKATAHFDKMDNLSLVSNSLPFNNMMAMYLRLGQPEKVSELVVAMKKRNISPCDITYSMWIQSRGSLNDLDGVEKIIDEMNADIEDRSSSDTFGNLAAIYAKAGLNDKAESALKSMEKKLKPRNLAGYHFLISLYAGISKGAEVYRVWDLLKKTYPKPNNSSYLAMLQALSRLQDIDGIKKIFLEWESTCWSYDMRLPNIVISSYLKENMYEEAEAIFNGAKSKCTGRFSKARQFLMMYLLENNQADLALKQFEEAVLDEDKDWTWSSDLISSFFLHFEKIKDVDVAEEFCKTLAKSRPLDSETYTLLMKTYVAAGKECPDMRERLEGQGLEVNEEQEGLLNKISP